MKRLSDKDPKTKLRKGELLIFEEAGANMGSLDFQNKVSKVFSYVLQSFRSLNIGILFNLPVEGSLSKSFLFTKRPVTFQNSAIVIPI